MSAGEKAVWEADIGFVITGYGLHKLKGDRKNCWSIIVNGNWRLTFEFYNGDAYLVNYEDYH